MKLNKLLLVTLSLLSTSWGFSQVDFFTGDFKYSLPIMSVPSPDGPPIPLTLSYSGGTQVEQKASWVGLGWNLSIGSIQRTVNGVPDDWKGGTHLRSTYNGNKVHFKDEVSRYYGPAYYKDYYEGINLNNQGGILDDNGVLMKDPKNHPLASAFKERIMDTYTSYYPQEATTFKFPDYDDYLVMGPGIGGVMKPFLFENNGKLMGKEGLSYWEHPFKNSVQFRLLGEGNSIKAPAFYDAGTGNNSGLVMNTGYSNWSYSKNGNETSFAHPDRNFTTIDNDIISHLNIKNLGAGVTLTTNQNYRGAIDVSSDVPKNTTTIKYYTNEEVLNLLSNTTTGFFINAPELSVTERSSYTASDVGAFAVTNLQGYTYHYSIPVYNLERTQFEAEYSIDKTSGLHQLDSLRKTTKDGFVIRWLLSAVTGPNYKDVNNNKEVDDGDEGYWVLYKYGQWSDEFYSQSPYNGLTALFNIEPDAEYYHGRLHHENAVTKSQSKSKNIIWYIDFIKTKSHTALFIKDIRKDGHSKPITNTSAPTPILKLSKVVLMRTEDANNYNWYNSANLSDAAGFDLSKVNANQLLHSAAFTQNNVPNNEILSSVEFSQDYSLASKYENNINTLNGTTFDPPNYLINSTNGKWMEKLVDETILSISNNVVQSGKLTLNKVQFYGYNNDKSKLPYYDFVYGNNPDYNREHVDYWGYYNSQGNLSELYASVVRPDDVDAWSMTEISNPYSGKTIIEYESDEYELVGKDKPLRTFRVAQADIVDFASFSSTKGTVTYNDDCENFYLDQLQNNNVEHVRLRIPFKFTDPNATAGQSYYTHAVFDAKGTQLSSIMQLGLNKAIVVTPEITGLMIPFPSVANGTITTIEDVEYSGISIALKKDYGGGVRVKSIKTQSPNDDSEFYKVNYHYDDGVASNEPTLLSPPYAGKLLNNWSMYDRHLYSPKVGYSKVTVTSESIVEGGSTTVDAPLKRVYSFYNYNDKNIRPFDITKKLTQKFTEAIRVGSGNYVINENEPGTYHRLEQFEVLTIDDKKTFYVGKSYKQETIDQHDNILSVSNTRYKDGGNTGEYFVGHNRFTTKTPKTFLGTPFGFLYMREGMPLYIEQNSIYIKDYRTQLLDYQTSYSGGVGSRFEVLERDPLIGTPTKTKTSSKETEIIKERTLAYTQYPTMGLKSMNDSYDNFLTAASKEKVFKNNKLMSGYYHTFDKDMMVRKLVGSNYVTALETDKKWFVKETFAFQGNENEASWPKVSEATLFNERGSLLESKDPYDNYASVKYGYDNRFTLATLGDGKYCEFAYSGAEDLQTNGYFGGEVSKGSGQVISSTKHTGLSALQVTNGSSGFIYSTTISQGLESGRTYKASVWLYDNGNTNHTANLSYSFTGGSLVSVNKQDVSSVKAGSWYLLTIEIPIPGNLSSGTLTIQCNAGNTTAVFDDFRFHPRDEPIETYVYDPIRNNVIAVLDVENFYSRFEYDNFGKLHKTFRETLEGEKQVTESTYNFKQKTN
jgi:hypothetical protein